LLFKYAVSSIEGYFNVIEIKKQQFVEKKQHFFLCGKKDTLVFQSIISFNILIINNFMIKLPVNKPS